VASYSRSVGRDGLLNRAVVSVSGWPDTPFANKDLRIRNDATSQTNRGLFEAQVDDAGVTSDAIRDLIGDFHVLIRKNPRQLITYQLSVNARPAPFVDYVVGDQIRARAVVRGSIRFDVTSRVWGITFNIDNQGNENTELELVMPS
jgi:hypothetical protein